jgi:tRNA (guanine-N7-)-methyltransferase
MRVVRRRGVDYSGVWLDEPSGSVPFDPREWFDDDRPLEWEIGSGRGMFLLDAAASHPEVHYIGVEWAKKYARMIADQIIRRRLGNARIFSCDAELMLAYWRPAGLDAVHILFPDPWWKRSHRKKRIVRPEVIARLAELIKSGGRLQLATDVEEYFGSMLKTLAGEPRFVPAEGPITINADSGIEFPKTHFERKYRAEGRPVHRVVYRRV